MERSLVRTGSESGRKVSEEVIRLYMIILGETLWQADTQTVYRPASDCRSHLDHETGSSSIFFPYYTVKLAEKMVRDSVLYLNDSPTQIQVVCQFFLRGTCKFGDQCRNEHPQNGDRRSAFANQSIGSTWTPASGQRTIPYRHALTTSLL